jgi:iron complex transport system substrate-binding protein
MNPDLIIVFVGDYEGVIRDPRWRGLKAVQNRRVYVSISSNRYTFNLAQPLGSRWMAELAYPDRLQPKLRALFREHYRENYGYSLSEAEVDELLNVAENRNAAGYERFMNPQEPARHEQRHQKPR